MSYGYRIYDQYAAHFLTFSVVDWVDVFTRQVYRDSIIDSLKHCTKERELAIYAYVIMSNHIHLIARSKNGTLSATVRDMKKFTSNCIIDTIKEKPESRREWLLHRFSWNAAQHARNSVFQVWTHDNHPVEIHSRPFFEQKLNYIHQNPVRAGWVEYAEDYLYSSAKAVAESRTIHFELSQW